MSKMVQTCNNNNNNNNNVSIGVYKCADTTAQVPIASTITQVQHKCTETKKTNTKDTRQEQKI
jgi:hypothetical protein